MKTSLLNTKEGIIISTIDAINELGLQNVSTKEIAKRQGVSEGTLFRHFKNKTDILLAVLNHFSQFDEDIIQVSVNRKLNPIDTIKYYIETYYQYYESYPAITAILHVYDNLMYEEVLSDKIKNIIEIRTTFLKDTIEKAQEEELIKAEVSAQILTDLILGGSRETCLKWRIEGFDFSLKERTVTMVNTLINAFIIDK
ncbi:TetR/AcrR family transcriptional regulator [Clostridium sp. YIM B02551]|uniref:TetR/AcrR family transcriptional regulator n=1 Tax=Clostridium sp. YIM B02551 TaxID=2910679 RepID=UPI001EEB5336|nr:TetR/AcrR family transcriptional regulator [Clostridium sp. YIM B02551]